MSSNTPACRQVPPATGVGAAAVTGAGGGSVDAGAPDTAGGGAAAGADAGHDDTEYCLGKRLGGGIEEKTGDSPVEGGEKDPGEKNRVAICRVVAGEADCPQRLGCR